MGQRSIQLSIQLLLEYSPALYRVLWVKFLPEAAHFVPKMITIGMLFCIRVLSGDYILGLNENQGGGKLKDC